MKTIKESIFYYDLVSGAKFDGIFEIPHIPGPDTYTIPDFLTPFSMKTSNPTANNCIMFYEHDYKFQDILINTKDYIESLRLYDSVITPDFSLYRDMPLSLQIRNVYYNRAIGFYFWKNGLNTIPNVRWGDERSYTSSIFSEPFAFQGIDKNSIVSIGSYDCIRGNENLYHFENGLKEMIKYLSPKIVLIYGSIPERILDTYSKETTLICYKDWISMKKQHLTNQRYN